MDTSYKLKSQFIKPVITGATSAVVLRGMVGDQPINIAGQKVSSYTAGFALGVASDFTTELISNWILPHITPSKAATKFESIALNLGGGAASFAVLPKLLNSEANMTELKKFALAGAVSQVAASYIYDNFISGENSLLKL